MGRPVGAVGPKVGAARGRVPFAGQSYEILRDSAAARPFFLHRPSVVRRAPRTLFPSRLVRSKSCAFSVSAPQFFRRSPALFSFGGRIALLRGGEVRRPSRAYRAPVSHFSFFPFTASPTPHNSLTICPLWVKALRFRLHLGRHFRTAAVAVGVRRNGRGAKLANSC